MPVVSLFFPGKSEKKVVFTEGERARDILTRENLWVDEVILLIDGKPVPEDIPLKDNMSISIIPVVSGG